MNIVLTQQDNSVVLNSADNAGVTLQPSVAPVVLQVQGSAAALPGGPTFIQNTAPVVSGPYLWVQTGLGQSGQDITMWIEDGQP